MRKRLGRIFLAVSLLLAVLAVLGGIVNGETPAGFWLGASWIAIVLLFNVWVGSQRSKKICPQCAENVLSAANVCRHCGYRFG
jgi:ribosomal protein L40E